MKIEKSKYSGYLWYSNAKEPQIIDNEFELDFDENEVPFIVEGQLFDGKKSFSIKFVDGKYVVKEYDLEKLKDMTKVEKTYQSHRMKDNRLLKFHLYWKEEEDPLCENMKVLQPAELVFVGFEK